MFLDHDKKAYLDDLTSILGRGWRPGAVVVADNVRIPGAPRYREYMRRQQGTLWNTVERAPRIPVTGVRPGAGVGRPGPSVELMSGSGDWANNSTFGAELLGARVGPGPHLAQRVHGHQRVDLRRRHRGMAE